jgi:tetratricopeptide (TPR) repeat protein
MGKNAIPGAMILLAAMACLPARLPAQADASGYPDAVRLVQQRQFDRAIPMIERILAAHPADLKARNLIGIALSAAGRRQEANGHFLKVLELDPAFLPALKNLGLNELALGERQQAATHLEKALKLAPHDPVIHFGLAELNHAEGRHEEALAHYADSSELYLRDPAATVRYARSCVEMKKTEAALSALARLDPAADAPTHFQAGVLLARLEKYAEAAGQFTIAQPQYPDPYEVGYNLTLAWLRAKDAARAIDTGEKLIAAGHKKPELYNLLSHAYEEAGRTKGAYDALRAATELDPRDEISYIDLMTLCLKHENFDLSLEISEIALKFVPHSSRVRLERGVAMAMKGRFEDAEAEFLAATVAAPREPLPYVALALARLQMNKLPEAIDLLRQRRKINASDYLADWFLGEAISRAGAEPGSAEEKEAVAALEDAARANPRAAAARSLLGKFLAKRGETERAAAAFEAALALDPDDTTAAYQLAVLCRKRGDTKRAEELFAKVSKAKAEDRDQFTQRTLVKIIREGSQ